MTSGACPKVYEMASEEEPPLRKPLSGRVAAEWRRLGVRVPSAIWKGKMECGAVTISTIEVAGRGVRRQLHSDFSQLRKEGWLVVQLGGVARTLHPCPRVPMPPSVIGARDHPYSFLQRDYHESGSPRYRVGSCRRLTQRRIFSPGGGHVSLTGVPSASAVVSTIPSPRIGRNSNLASCVMRSLRQRSPRDRIRKHAAA